MKLDLDALLSKPKAAKTPAAPSLEELTARGSPWRKQGRELFLAMRAGDSKKVDKLLAAMGLDLTRGHRGTSDVIDSTGFRFRTTNCVVVPAPPQELPNSIKVSADFFGDSGIKVKPAEPVINKKNGKIVVPFVDAKGTVLVHVQPVLLFAALEGALATLHFPMTVSPKRKDLDNQRLLIIHDGPPGLAYVTPYLME